MQKKSLDIYSSIEWLSAGKILAHPTEGIWGLGCDALNKSSFSKIYDLKKRPQWYMEKSYSNFWTPIKMIYSISIYLIILVGFFYSLRRLDLTFNFLLIISALYMFFMLGWVGTNRYFSTSLIYLSVYFAYGLQYFLNLEILRKYKFKK